MGGGASVESVVESMAEFQTPEFRTVGSEQTGCGKEAYKLCAKNSWFSSKPPEGSNFALYRCGRRGQQGRWFDNEKYRESVSSECSYFYCDSCFPAASNKHLTEMREADRKCKEYEAEYWADVAAGKIVPKNKQSTQTSNAGYQQVSQQQQQSMHQMQMRMAQHQIVHNTSHHWNNGGYNAHHAPQHTQHQVYSPPTQQHHYNSPSWNNPAPSTAPTAYAPSGSAYGQTGTANYPTYSNYSGGHGYSNAQTLASPSTYQSTSSAYTPFAPATNSAYTPYGSSTGAYGAYGGGSGGRGGGGGSTAPYGAYSRFNCALCACTALTCSGADWLQAGGGIGEERCMYCGHFGYAHNLDPYSYDALGNLCG